MNMKKAYLVWALALFLVVGLIGGCGPDTPADPVDDSDDKDVADPDDPVVDDGPAYGGTVYRGSIGDASTFNPILIADNASSEISSFVNRGMMRVDETLAFIPALAKDWETSEDGLTWTFYLRDDIHWQDGVKLTANDVKFTFLSIMYPGYTGVRQRDYDALRGADEYLTLLREMGAKRNNEEITEAEYTEAVYAAYEEFKAKDPIVVVNDYQIDFNLDRIHSPMMANVSMGVIPKHILEDHMGRDMVDHPHSRKPVGLGPYYLDEWVTAEHIVVRAHDDYFDGRPYIDAIVTKVIPDQNTLMIAIETSEIDFGGILPEDFERFSAMPHVTTMEFPSLSYTYLGMHQDMAIFEDIRTRQAIAHGIDRETIVAELYRGHGIVAHTHGSPARWDYNPDVHIYEYDPDRAAALLADAGWEPGPDGILQKDGVRFSFTLETNAGNTIRETSSVIIQDQLGELGIEVDVELIEWNTFVNNHLMPQNFEAVIVGWALGVDPDCYTIWHTEGGVFNFVNYSNERVDELIDLGRGETDPELRTQYYSEMQEILSYEVPYVFLFFPNSLIAINNRVEGPFTPHPSNFAWNIDEWWIPEEFQTR